jgi:hypothetical protein
MLAAALRYAAHGWPVFPLKPGGKDPLTSHGFKDATTSAERIREWWRRCPNANIGLPTGKSSGVVALDLDGPAAPQSLLELGAAVVTLTSVTDKGHHLLFQCPPYPVRSRVRLKPDIDVRGDGGYIILPPSVHPSGRSYHWDEQNHMGWGTALAVLPSIVSDALVSSETGSSDLTTTAAAEPPPIPEGQRNDTLFRLGCAMRGKGFTAQEIEAALLVANKTRCEPSLPEPEVRRIASSTGRYAPGSLPVIIVHDRNDQSAQEEDVRSLMSYPEWPTPLGAAAYYGLVGEIVRALERYSEADPAGILVHALVMFGSAIGRAAFYEVEATRHHTNEFAIFVGPTSSGRKGTAYNQALAVFNGAAVQWTEDRIQSGLSSGEGLIAAVRDRVMGKDDEVADPGVTDKRLLVKEAEFASTLRVARREGNTLTGVIREAFDTGKLGTMTKTNRTTASGAHISIIGHTTPEELRRYVDRTDIANGFMNRFLIICVKRSKLLPDGGSPPAELLAMLSAKLGSVIESAREPRQLARTAEARDRWRAEYPALTEPAYAGLLAALTDRAEAHVLRLSCLYALLDRGAAIDVPHLEAALEIWRYSRESAAVVFGDVLGDPVADAIVGALRRSPTGLTRTDIRDLFGRNQKRQRIQAALELLNRQGVAAVRQEETHGRPRERWTAV